MTILMALVALIISLIVIIGLHEAGHALAAFYFNIKIQKISIGFGRALIKWQSKRGCQWVWSLWPVGGYVQLLNTRTSTVSVSDYPYCFDKKPIWIRCLVLLSGSVTNLLVAWIALTWLLLLGYKQFVPVIAAVTPNTVAARAGIESGDKIIEVNGVPVASWQVVSMEMLKAVDNPLIHLTVMRKGRAKQLTFANQNGFFQGKPRSLLVSLGITPDPATRFIQSVKGVSLITAGYQAGLKVVDLLAFFIILIKQIVIGAIPISVLLGPIGLFSITVGSFQQGLSVFLFFIANLSLSVGLVNLLPIPTLDGGSIIYALIEWVRGRPITISVEILIHRLIFIAFWVLLVQLLVNDLHHIVH